MLSLLRRFPIFANAPVDGEPPNPWGKRPETPSGNGGKQDGGNNPWGQNRGPQRPRGGSGDPDLDAVLRHAQERFRTVFGGGGQGGRGGRTGGGQPAGSGRLLGGVIVIAALVWLGSGFYRVEPQENAVILTFGKMTDTRAEAGLGYALPWPVQEVQKVDVAFDRRLEIGFRDQTGGSGDIPNESLMVTGDENIIDIDFVVLWRIGDAAKYLFEIRDPETTVKKVAESAMREIIGRTAIQKALTEARGQVEIDTKALMQKMLDEYESGIVINSVQLLKVDPPADVVDAFDDVQRARSDLERARNEAETYRNDIVPKARGEAKKMLEEAEAYKQATVSRAKGDADRFTAIQGAYAVSKDVTQKRLYLETMQQVMQKSRKLIVSEGGANILPYLPLDQIKPAAGAAAATAPKE